MKILAWPRRFLLVTAITVFALIAILGCSRKDSMGGVGRRDGAAPDLATSPGGADGSAGGPEDCPAGFVWMVSGYSVKTAMGHTFNSFCGQTCAVSPDCPVGMTCVQEAYTDATPRVPVCVSDTVPPPIKKGEMGHEDYGPTCQNSTTLTKQYWGSGTGFMGVETIPCPKGCQENPSLGSLGGDSCSDVPLEQFACDPFAPAPKPIALGEIFAIGKTADGVLYVVDQSKGVQRIFVSNNGTLVRQRIAGSDSTTHPDGSKAYSFSVDSATDADAGAIAFALAIEIDSQGKVRMGVVQGALADKTFVIGQQGEELTVLKTSDVSGMPVQNLPGEVHLEYAATMQFLRPRTLVVVRPADDWTLSDFRLFVGNTAIRLVEYKVTDVQRAQDGGSTTITFDNGGIPAVAKFPVLFVDGGIVAGPATLESESFKAPLDLLLAPPTGVSYQCLPMP